MSIKHTEDFKQEAVRIALTSGVTTSSGRIGFRGWVFNSWQMGIGVSTCGCFGCPAG